MHELTITEHLLDHCIQEARSQNASRIRTIRVCIGELRGIVPDCIQIYLDMLSEGTIAEGKSILPRLRSGGRDHPEASGLSALRRTEP